MRLRFKSRAADAAGSRLCACDGERTWRHEAQLRDHQFSYFAEPRSAEELWPDLSPEEQETRGRELERIAQENPAYEELGEDVCGRAELAGKSVAVPFVGVTAATLVVAEIIRLLHDGSAYSDIKLSLSDLRNVSATSKRSYTAQDSAGIEFCDAEMEGEDLGSLAVASE